MMLFDMDIGQGEGNGSFRMPFLRKGGGDRLLKMNWKSLTGVGGLVTKMKNGIDKSTAP